MRSSKKSNDKSQLDKFKDIAREVDADEDEQAFDDKLRRMRYHDTTDKEPPHDGR